VRTRKKEVREQREKNSKRTKKKGGEESVGKKIAGWHQRYRGCAGSALVARPHTVF